MWLTVLSLGARALPFLKSPKVVASIVGLVAVGALWWYVGSLRGTVEDLTAEKAQLTLLYSQSQSANETNLSTIMTLQAANESLASAIVIREDERVVAARAAAERAARAAIQLDDTLDTLEELRNESTSCEELSKIDMDALCPLVTERLRKHALGPNSQD